MADFINNFVGGSIADYPFVAAVLGVVMSSVVVFMFYTIIASLFRWK